MDPERTRELAAAGAITLLPDGRTGVRVSLQYRPRLQPSSRDARGAELRGHFAQLAERLSDRGAVVDLDSLSVSGQTVEATLPADTFDELAADLGAHEVRVDPIVARRATQE